MTEDKETLAGRGVRGGGYLFIPKGFQRADIILWLRRFHAWTGVFGAALFFVFGFTGVYLNHERHWKIEGGRMIETASLNVVVEPGSIDTVDALASWTRREFRLKGAQTGGGRKEGQFVLFDGRPVRQPDSLNVQFRGPNALIVATHDIGSNLVTVRRQNASPLKALIHLHVSSGANKAYILLADAIAGALMFMSLSGVLLWTRLHGGRLVAAGIAGGFLIFFILSVATAWIGWSPP